MVFLFPIERALKLHQCFENAQPMSATVDNRYFSRAFTAPHAGLKLHVARPRETRIPNCDLLSRPSKIGGPRWANHVPRRYRITRFRLACQEKGAIVGGHGRRPTWPQQAPKSTGVVCHFRNGCKQLDRSKQNGLGGTRNPGATGVGP